MTADKRIPVTEKVWADLFSLRKPGQTYNELLEEMIAAKQEQDFLKHIDNLEKAGEFESIEKLMKKVKTK
ncbi:MAG: hypothetical protein WC998_08695 [Candidatus Paceibacterota bacterium]|jgi:hypothetical protein